MDIGPVELILVLVIVTMLFGVGKIPEVFGAVGKGIREFRSNMNDLTDVDSTSNSDSDTLKSDGNAPAGSEDAPKL